MVSPLDYYLNLNQRRPPHAAEQAPTNSHPKSPETEDTVTTGFTTMKEADRSISALFVSDDEGDGEDSDYGSIAHDDTFTPEISSTTGDDGDTIEIGRSPRRKVSKTSRAPSRPGSEIPKALRTKLEQWHYRHGSWPNCILGRGLRNVNMTSSGQEAKWTHVSGQTLAVEFFRLPAQRRLLTASGPGLGPFIIRNDREGHTKGVNNYKIWLGLGKGDDDGFEVTASVFKTYIDHRDVPNLLPTDLNPVSKQDPPAIPSRRARADTSDSGLSLLTPFKKRRVHSQTPSRTTPNNPETMGNAAVTVSDDYFRSHTMLRFHSHHHEASTVRERPLSVCPTSVRLFDQMKAGRVFPPTSDSRLVYAEIAGVGDDLALVEGDEEDYQSLLVWIRSNGGFAVGADGMEAGTCAVNISAAGF